MAYISLSYLLPLLLSPLLSSSPLLLSSHHLFLSPQLSSKRSFHPLSSTDPSPRSFTLEFRDHETVVDVHQFPVFTLPVVNTPVLIVPVVVFPGLLRFIVHHARNNDAMVRGTIMYDFFIAMRLATKKNETVPYY